MRNLNIKGNFITWITLTHWDLGKKAPEVQTTFSNAFLWVTNVLFDSLAFITRGSIDIKPASLKKIHNLVRCRQDISIAWINDDKAYERIYISHNHKLVQVCVIFENW